MGFTQEDMTNAYVHFTLESLTSAQVSTLEDEYIFTPCVFLQRADIMDLPCLNVPI